MSVIEEVKQRTDIVEVIGQYTKLKKSGKNMSGLCPFHSEKNPSFYVYPEQQSWHCFGACSTGGDVLSFIMKKEGLEFGEALRMLADRAGVVIPSRIERPEDKGEKEEIYQINEAAAVYFHNLLLNSPGAEKARQYVESRGFSSKTVADFQLGFSLDSWEALKQYLKEKGYDENTMLKAGLIIEAENGKTHDRFRGKLMIPIHDSKGRTTGFGSRVLDDSLPKYVNSPQTPTFDKSSTLYAIDLAAAAIRKQDAAIIMEGYMDVITAHQNGITNVVACMGTAITETQVNTLKKLSKHLLLALDADAAGEEAMLRTVGYENIVGAEMKVITLPEGKDPDDLIREDMELWNSLVETAVPLVDFTFDKTIAHLDLTAASDKSLAVERLLPVVAEIKDPIRQAHYMQKLAAMVKVGLPTIEAALARLRPAPARRRQAVPKPAAAARQRNLTSDAREEYCLTLLCNFPELRERQQEVSGDYFECSENREIFTAWQKTEDLSSLHECLDPTVCEHLDVIINRALPEKNNIERRFTDCVNELKKKYYRNMAARKAESGDVSEADLEISTQLKSIFAQRNHRKL
jgi:DNA primase